MIEVNKEELRRLAGHASTGGWDRKRVFGQLNIQDDNHMLGDNDAAFIAAAHPAAILSLLDEHDAREKKARETSLLWLDENAQLRAENERLRKDAERYQWMAKRDRWASLSVDFDRSSTYMRHRVIWFSGDDWPQVEGQTIDEAVDAAMAKEVNSNP